MARSLLVCIGILTLASAALCYGGGPHGHGGEKWRGCNNHRQDTPYTTVILMQQSEQQKTTQPPTQPPNNEASGGTKSATSISAPKTVEESYEQQEDKFILSRRRRDDEKVKKGKLTNHLTSASFDASGKNKDNKVSEIEANKKFHIKADVQESGAIKTTAVKDQAAKITEGSHSDTTWHTLNDENAGAGTKTTSKLAGAVKISAVTYDNTKRTDGLHSDPARYKSDVNTATNKHSNVEVGTKANIEKTGAVKTSVVSDKRMEGLISDPSGQSLGHGNKYGGKAMRKASSGAGFSLDRKGNSASSYSAGKSENDENAGAGTKTISNLAGGFTSIQRERAGKISATNYNAKITKDLHSDAARYKSDVNTATNKHSNVEVGTKANIEKTGAVKTSVVSDKRMEGLISDPSGQSLGHGNKYGEKAMRKASSGAGFSFDIKGNSASSFSAGKSGIIASHYKKEK